MTHRIFGLLALAGGLIVNMNAGTIVQDGGFEVPSGTYYTGSLGDGWTATQGTIDIFTAADGLGGVPHSGNQFVYLDNSGTLNTVSQTLATVIGQSYVGGRRGAGRVERQLRDPGSVQRRRTEQGCGCGKRLCQLSIHRHRDVDQHNALV